MRPRGQPRENMLVCRPGLETVIPWHPAIGTLSATRPPGRHGAGAGVSAKQSEQAAEGRFPPHFPAA